MTRKINEIIIHCSATKPEWMAGRHLADKVAEIRKWHVRDNGWNDIGYHWLIDRDGSVMAGRSETVAGAHVSGRNANTIGVCLLGGHGSNENDPFSKNFTAAQDAALRKLISNIRGRYGNIPVNGHNQYAAKACPGFNAPSWFATASVGPVPTLPTPAPSGGLIAALLAILKKIFGGVK